MRQITNKKGNLNLLVPAILTLTLAAIILVFGLVMLESLRDETSANSEAHNATNDTIAGLGDFADYWDLIVLAIVISIIISLLLVVFSLRRAK